MKYSIVYSSRTGNTALLAESIRKVLPEEDCIYFGQPDPEALKAEKIYAGFWTDKGSCDSLTGDFLKTIRDSQLFLFGTAGFGGNQEYYDKIIGKAAKNLHKSVSMSGSFMCQGKMPAAVRRRYEKMMESPVKMPNLAGMIENFDRALSHPDEKDLEALKKAVLEDF